MGTKYRIESAKQESTFHPLLTTAILFACWNGEPVFVNVYGAQESIARKRFRQSM
jgi:hypothetical protein